MPKHKARRDSLSSYLLDTTLVSSALIGLSLIGKRRRKKKNN